MAMKIEVQHSNPVLTIGDDYAETNTIEFTITFTGNGTVWPRLTIPIGDTGVVYELPQAQRLSIETDPKPVQDQEAATQKSWTLGHASKGIKVDGSKSLRVKISKIRCVASVGDSTLMVDGKSRDAAQKDADPTKWNTSVPVKKAKPTTPPANPILYFIATPAYLLGSRGKAAVGNKLNVSLPR
jgi:hypothetical protein